MQDAFSAIDLADGTELEGYTIEEPLSAGAMTTGLVPELRLTICFKAIDTFYSRQRLTILDRPKREGAPFMIVKRYYISSQ